MKYKKRTYKLPGDVVDASGYRKGYLGVNLVSQFRQRAKWRKKYWQLSTPFAFNLIIKECHYCPAKPDWPHSYMGLDRLDNSKGYTEDNTVPCCFKCNSAKNDMTIEDFKKWLKSVISKINTL